MKTSRPREGRYAGAFRERYLGSLHDYRFFYDDISEVGNAAAADQVFYFVPGLNGTPGQMRFALPSIVRVFGSRVYLKALHLPEFSARIPIWEKYSPANLDRKLARLRSDLELLLDRHPRIIVVASSSGFYDFAAAAGELPPATLRDRVHLLWAACAPDHFEPTPWERVFYPLNGFEQGGHRWFAYPNHNLFKAINPETSHSHLWRDGPQARLFLKVDLESRFHFFGLEWSYVSPSQFRATTRHVVRQIRGPLPCPALALVAANDGYWQGKPRDAVTRTIQHYLPECQPVFKSASHLWVVTPSHVTELLTHLKRGLPAAAQLSQPIT